MKQLTGVQTVQFIGKSKAVETLLNDVKKVAPGDNPVLLEGETGTGKQVLARYIHANSQRKDEPFVAVNCAAITETLFESELFGHEKGAFTGAISRKAGKLELVGRGTLFLDEIGELPLLCQAKLLTAIEDRVFERVGGTHTLEFEGRVIAATNRDITKEIKAGRFRKDLYFRLGAIHQKLPPLRSRPEDVPVYLDWAVENCRRRIGKEFNKPSDSIIEKLCCYTWPGNVRELLNHVERVALMSEGADAKSSLWLSLQTALEGEEEAVDEDLRAALDVFKKRHILRIVGTCSGNQTEAAKRLGIERTHLNRLLAQYEGRRQS